MSAPADNLIPEDEELALHGRLAGGDPTASADLARTYLDHLISWLVRKNKSTVPEDLCIEAAEDALIALAKSPTSFNPARGKRLGAYLRMSAQGDLQNILRRERRHWNQPSLEVELSRDGGKYLLVDDDPSLPLELEEESARATRTIVSGARDGLTEGESRALDLLLQGERKTAAFAQVLGIADLPKETQRLEVKRVKDRLKMRIKRGMCGDGEPS